MSVNWDTLRRHSLQPGGFGTDRAHIWPQLLNAHSAPSSSSSNSEPHRDENQISLDTSRSFVLYPSTSSSFSERESLQQELHGLIVSLFRKRPKLSYFQGYHDIVSVLMLTLPKDLQLACLEKLSLHWLRDSMGSGLEPVLGLLRVTKNLIKLADPELASMLEQSTQLPFFALSNLLTLFSHDTPTLPLIQHVFDYLLCRPPIAVVYLATAIVLSRKEEVRRLMEEDEDGMIHSLLSSLPTLVDEPDPPPPIPDDPSTSPIPTESSASALRPQSNGLPVRSSPSPLPQSVDDTDITIVADPELDSPQNTESVEQTKIPTFSPPPESDLTLVDSDPADIVVQEEKDKVEEVDGIVPPPEQHLLPAEKPLIDPEPSLIAEDDVSGNTNGSITPTKLLPSIEEANNGDSTTQLHTEHRDTHKTLITTTPFSSPSPSSAPSLPSAEPNTTPPTLSLPSLLTHASNLQILFPPTHPSLHLSQIMGPQSVVYTWSENFREWPNDNEAEAMATRMDLIVYPFDPDAEDDSDEDADSVTDEESYEEARKGVHGDGDKKREKGGRKRNKLTKSRSWKQRHKEKRRSEKPHRHTKRLGGIMDFAFSPFRHGKVERKMEKRTMLAGAVVVLGIAMALYGTKGGSASTGAAGMGGGTGEKASETDAYYQALLPIIYLKRHNNR
ncbi:hypothetical protein D9756_006763 [Leucocoprinus leucothites]|uniref:Rab-GAP TBC domain-containing protein n=1 Tax=Leucocoprinus leucothites TaxID=201217 RepID=A0A8H5G1V7_9AGAR|nr:hypothetical protein D9756_006763 [Leucoagaricus leucothites]